MLIVGNVLGPLKHHVLEEVREPGLADLLARRTDMIGHIDMHQRIGAVVMQQHRKAVVEHVLFVRDYDVVVNPVDFFDEPHIWRWLGLIPKRTGYGQQAKPQGKEGACIIHFC